jgi:Sterol-sensing domain of SREBP cleavage-activation
MQPAIQGGRLRGQMKPAPDLILEALDKAGNIIVRDYALEIAVLLIGAYSKVGGLKEFCALAALLLTVDCVATTTFYVAILSVMIEVRSTSRASGFRGSCSVLIVVFTLSHCLRCAALRCSVLCPCGGRLCQMASLP